MDTGPQIPTALSSMLNNGVNILQVVGQFNGSYIVVIASMSMTSTPDSAALPDYVQPESASVDPASSALRLLLKAFHVNISSVLIMRIISTLIQEDHHGVVLIVINMSASLKSALIKIWPRFCKKLGRTSMM